MKLKILSMPILFIGVITIATPDIKVMPKSDNYHLEADHDFDQFDELDAMVDAAIHTGVIAKEPVVQKEPSKVQDFVIKIGGKLLMQYLALKRYITGFFTNKNCVNL